MILFIYLMKTKKENALTRFERNGRMKFEVLGVEKEFHENEQ